MNTSSAQTFTSLYEADSLTYQLYLQQDWNALQKAGNEALKQGIDFYFLRVRLGIAYFEKKNYHKAIQHFEKAQANNPQDGFVRESLYYARLYAGRRAEALYSFKKPTEGLTRQKEMLGPKLLRQVDFFYNQNWPGNQELIQQFNPSQIPKEDDGGQFISDGHQYVYVGIRHELSPSFSYYHAYTHLSKNHFAYVQREGISSTNKQAKVSLNQYYGMAQVRIAKNLQWLAGLHYVNIQFPNPVVQSRQGREQIVWIEDQTGERVLFTGLSAQTTYMHATAMVYTGNLNFRNQFQSDLLLTVYPMGNLNLYFSGQFSFLRETLEKSSRNAMVFEPLAGTRISDKIWMEAYGAFGPQQNYIAGQGAVLFNTLDRVNTRIGGRVHVFPSSRLRVQLEGIGLQNESAFENKENLNLRSNIVSFNSYSITGGLSWYF